jgi:hypothetical protein
MPHSRSLRAIGQSLERLHVEAFALDKKNDSHIVRSESLTATRQWILRNSLVETVWDSPAREQKSTQLTGGDGWLSYDPVTISRLDAQGRKKRRGHFLAQTREPGLSDLLRTVGEQLDILRANNFNIFWRPDAVSVEYQKPGGQRERKDFSVEKLRELSLQLKFRRAQRDA